MNRSGFTTVEVVIASALIVTLITGGAIGMRQVNLLNQVAATRTSHTEMRTRVIAALSDSGTCAAALGNPKIFGSFGSGATIDVNAVTDMTAGVPIPILVNGKPAPGNEADGLIYKLALIFPSAVPDATFSSASTARTDTINRYQVQLEVRGERKTLKEMKGAQGDLVGKIPLSAEFDSTGVLVSCTTRHEDMDDLLLGNVHTVRDCLKVDGMPMPTAAGLICRIPVPYAPQLVTGYSGTIPTCASLAAGWSNIFNPPIPNYNSTHPIDRTLPKCKRGTVTEVTGWHSMSPVNVESKQIRFKRGADAGFSQFLAGTYVVGTILAAVFPGIGALYLAIAAFIGFLFSVFAKCESETKTFYAQVDAVGCI